MKLILVRHAQTQDNINHITSGSTDTPITALGESQIEKVAKRLRKEKIDAAYSSDLGRAIKTAKGILKFHETTLVEDARLRERNSSIWQGHPSGILAIKAREAGLHYIHYKPKGGESVIDMRDRAINFFEEISKKHEHDTVLVVCHGGPIINCFIYWMKDNPDSYLKYHADNTAVSFIEFYKDKLEVKLMNSISHLARSA